MVDLKLGRLPDRNPVKLTIAVMPDLHTALADYAALYAESYGATERVEDLIPPMLTLFLDGDRAFTKARLDAASGKKATGARASGRPG